jgi:IrrE N-terminal-like domain
MIKQHELPSWYARRMKERCKNHSKRVKLLKTDMKKYIKLRYSNDLPGIPLQRDIEKLALADRRSLGCRFGEPCDPRRLIKFYDVKKILETYDEYVVHYGRSVQGEIEDRWSGITFCINNGQHMIMINPEHRLPRRTFTIAHEFGHLVFNHRAIFIASKGMPQSRYSDEQELEAHSFGLAVLLPYAPLLQILRQCATVQGIALHYGVSTAAVEMRLKITGLWEMLTEV